MLWRQPRYLDRRLPRRWCALRVRWRCPRTPSGIEPEDSSSAQVIRSHTLKNNSDFCARLRRWAALSCSARAMRRLLQLPGTGTHAGHMLSTATHHQIARSGNLVLQDPRGLPERISIIGRRMSTQHRSLRALACRAAGTAIFAPACSAARAARTVYPRTHLRAHAN